MTKTASAVAAALLGAVAVFWGVILGGPWAAALSGTLIAVIVVDSLIRPGRVGLAGACATCMVCVAEPLAAAVGATFLAYAGTYFIKNRRGVLSWPGTAWVAGLSVVALAVALHWPVTQWDVSEWQDWSWPAYWVWAGLAIAAWLTVLDAVDRYRVPELPAEKQFLHPNIIRRPVAYRVMRVLAYATAGATLVVAVAQAQALLGWSAGVTLTALVAVLSLAVYTWLQEVTRAREVGFAAVAIEQRQEWLTRLVERQDEDRQEMIARIHDEPLQDMVAAATILEMYQLAGDAALPVQAHQLVLKAIDEVRDVMTSTGDTPQVLVRLSTALEHLARSSEVTVTTAIDESAGNGLTPECARSVYLVAREALQNVNKHAEADEVSLSLTKSANTLTLCVIDDGVGVGEEILAGASRPGHLGMVLMAARAALVGGTLDVHPRPGGGTVVKMTVPVGGATAAFNNGYQP